jgi:gluconate 5-dehydrogenase
VAIVTGGGRGIGKSIALTLAEAGADVVVTARTLKLLEETADEIRKLGTRALAVRADLTSERDVEAQVDKTISEFAKIDILVNNAGAIQSRPLVEIPGFKDYPAMLASIPIPLACIFPSTGYSDMLPVISPTC